MYGYQIARWTATVLLFIGMFAQNPMYSIIGVLVMIASLLLHTQSLEDRLRVLEGTDENETTPTA